MAEHLMEKTFGLIEGPSRTEGFMVASPRDSGLPDYMQFDVRGTEPLMAPRCLPHETVASTPWKVRWLEVLEEAMSENTSAWGLVGMRGNGDYWLFEATSSGVLRAVDWAAVKVWLLFPKWDA